MTKLETKLDDLAIKEIQKKLAMEAFMNREVKKIIYVKEPTLMQRIKQWLKID